MSKTRIVYRNTDISILLLYNVNVQSPISIYSPKMELDAVVRPEEGGAAGWTNYRAISRDLLPSCCMALFIELIADRVKSAPTIFTMVHFASPFEVDSPA
jgi:hypothetical protein